MRSTYKKLTGSIAVVIILAVCLCITTLALVLSIARVEDNSFVTGTVEINLNDGKPVINEDEFIFEPGMTVVKDFFLENESSCDVYYRIYFQNVEGGLGDVLDVSITSDGELLFNGKPSELSRENVQVASSALRLNETKTMQISFHFPENAGNDAQNLYLSFDLAADAVQAKNNSGRAFD